MQADRRKDDHQIAEEQNDLGEDYPHGDPAPQVQQWTATLPKINDVIGEPQLTPAQRRKIAQILLANRLASDSDCSFMAPGWCDAHLDFLAPNVVDATRKIRESLGLELVDDAAAANRELGKLLTEAADLRATAKAAIETIGTIHDRIDEISRWLADPSGKYPAQPIAFCA